jgi:hypothetical protein
MLLKLQICAVSDCGRPLTNYRDGRFCAIHHNYENKCGVQDCLHDALEDIPACEHHRQLYRQFETRFGRNRSMFTNRRQVRRRDAIAAGEVERQEWEPVPEQWDSTIKHFWQARHVKVVEIAVTACGIPVSHTKFPFSEGTNEIVRFMNDTWPSSHPERRPSFLAVDKGCQVMSTLDANGELIGNGGWMQTTRLKVDPWHYNGHQIDALCVNFCNPTDRRDPNLVQLLQEGNPREPQRADGHGRRAIGRRAADANAETFRRLFNFEASEHLNAWLEPFSATMTKMRPENHDIFLCIILRERANQVKSSSTPL